MEAFRLFHESTFYLAHKADRIPFSETHTPKDKNFIDIFQNIYLHQLFLLLLLLFYI